MVQVLVDLCCAGNCDFTARAVTLAGCYASQLSSSANDGLCLSAYACVHCVARYSSHALPVTDVVLQLRQGSDSLASCDVTVTARGLQVHARACVRLGALENLC